MIIDHCRDKQEFQKFFNLYSMPIQQQYNFDFVLNNPYLFCFYDEIKGFLRGYIMLTKEENKIYLSGASCRKNFENNIKAIKKICNSLNCDVYSFTKLKHAKLLLKKAGFKQINKDELLYKKTK